LRDVKTAVVVSELRLVEGLGLIELESVEGTDLVGVGVVLGSPEGAVPVLTVSTVTGSEFLRLEFLHLKGLAVVELAAGVTLAPVVLVLGVGAEVGLAEGGRVVVNGLMVGGGTHLGLGAEASGGGVELLIGLGHDFVVETGGSEVVRWRVKSCLVEHLAGLLSNGLLEEVVVNGDTGYVALVAGDNSGLLSGRDLGTHVVGGGSVEIVLGPLEELVLGVELANLVVAHVELGLGLEKIGWRGHL